MTGSVSIPLPAQPHEHLVPPTDRALELPVETLALHLLRAIVANHSLCNSHNVGNSDAWRGHVSHPRGREFLRAISEAWNWLERNGLVAPEPGGGGTHWYIVTRRGEEVAASNQGTSRLRAEARLDIDLHGRLGQRVRQVFLAGDLETAVLMAMKAVEVRVRELAGAGVTDIGVDLMRQSFRDQGPLADPALPAAEQQATMALFWGAYGVFRNPAAHREVDYEDSTMASEVILLADLLLRMLDAIAKRIGKT